MDRYGSAGQHHWVKVGMVLHRRPAADAPEADRTQDSEDIEVGPAADPRERLKKKGLARGSVVMSFCHHLIQPIMDRVHPTYEYSRQSGPTHEVNRKVSQEEVAARVTQIYTGRIRNKKCPKAHSLTRPADHVSPEITRSFWLM
jgi:hypothetical protein